MIALATGLLLAAIVPTPTFASAAGSLEVCPAVGPFWYIVCLQSEPGGPTCAATLLGQIACADSDGATDCVFVPLIGSQTCHAPAEGENEGCDEYGDDYSCWDYEESSRHLWSNNVAAKGSESVVEMDGWSRVRFHAGACTEVISDVTERIRVEFGWARVALGSLYHDAWHATGNGSYELKDPCGENFFGMDLPPGEYDLRYDWVLARTGPIFQVAGAPAAAWASPRVTHAEATDRNDASQHSCFVAVDSDLEASLGGTGVHETPWELVSCEPPRP